MPSTVKTKKANRVTLGSGNVFADLGLVQPELALAKAQLVQRIRELIEKRKWTQTEAARVLNLDQPKVSALVRGQLKGFSLDRLFRIINQLGHDIEIRLIPSTAKAQETKIRMRRSNSIDRPHSVA